MYDSVRSRREIAGEAPLRRLLSAFGPAFDSELFELQDYVVPTIVAAATVVFGMITAVFPTGGVLQETKETELFLPKSAPLAARGGDEE